MLTHYVKVKVGKNKAIFLEGAKYVTSKGITFISGHQVDKNCEGPKIDVLHLIQCGTTSSGSMPLFTPAPEVKIWSCEVDRFYCEIKTTGRIQ